MSAPEGRLPPHPRMAEIAMRRLHPRLRLAWRAETSAVPAEWTPDNPARGQCAITALLVQEVYGGDLLRCTVGGQSHYYNRLPDLSELDLTLEQFSGLGYDPDTIEHRSREYVLSFPETRRRFELLQTLMAEPRYPV